MLKTAKSFILEETRGGISSLILVMFVGLVLLTGLAIDLLRQEAERADLQNAIDRGVLAAAALTQPLDAETTVNSYVDTRLLSESDVEVRIVPDTALNFRRISASAAYDNQTIFLRIAGDPDLPVVASSAAEERRQDVEISLVLDISGSMARERSSGTENSRLQVMRAAATEFVNLVLNDDSKANTSVSLIPFSGQVNAGPFFNYLTPSRVHSFSSCVDFSDSDYSVSTLPGANTRSQTQHFQWFSFEGFSGHEAEWGWCPRDQQALVPFSNDRSILADRIANFTGHDGTGTQNGMKWGLSLLDPSVQPLISALANANVVPSTFSNRPANFNDTGALKVIVLMTDGNIRYQPRVLNQYYNSQSERNFWATVNNENRLNGFVVRNGRVVRDNAASFSTLPNNSSRNTDEVLRSQQFLDLCNVARTKGITVFTIGFDISSTSDAFTEMSTCASSAAHFYDVEGLELATAFRQIAATISKLKLVE